MDRIVALKVASVGEQSLDPQRLSHRPAWMLNKSLRDSMEVVLYYASGHSTMHQMKFMDAGQNRIAFSSLNSAIVLKMNPSDAKSHNREEWNLYNSSSVLFQEVIPRVYGLGLIKLGLEQYDGLVCERIAFTVERIFNIICRKPATPASISYVTVITEEVLKLLVYAGHVCQKHCRDWHTQNLALQDGDELKVKLIAWADHSDAPWSKTRDRIRNAYQAFMSYYANVDMNPDWRNIFTDLEAKIREWWRVDSTDMNTLHLENLIRTIPPKTGRRSQR